MVEGKRKPKNVDVLTSTDCADKSMLSEILNYFQKYEIFYPFKVDLNSKKGTVVYLSALKEILADLGNSCDMKQIFNYDNANLTVKNNFRDFIGVSDKGTVYLKNDFKDKTHIFAMPIVADELINHIQGKKVMLNKSPRSYLLALTISEGQVSSKLSEMVTEVITQGNDEVTSTVNLNNAVMNFIAKKVTNSHQYDRERICFTDEDNIISNPEYFSLVDEFFNSLRKIPYIVKSVSKFIYAILKKSDESSLYLNRYINSDKDIAVQFGGFPNSNNSFYLKDITTVLNKIEKSENIGMALKRYLSLSCNDKFKKCRIDLLEKSNIDVYKNFQESTSLIRWPKKYDENLMSKLTADIFFQSISKNSKNGFGTLLSVNGVPGSGKTSLVKNITSEILLNKVIYLQSEAFKPIRKTTSNNVPYFDLGSKIKNFSIVVASSNNTAIKNITDDLPNDPYLFNNDFCFIGQDISEGRWGAISQTLGKYENRLKFFNYIMPVVTGRSLIVNGLSDFKQDHFRRKVKENISKSSYIRDLDEINDINDEAWQKGLKKSSQFISENDDILSNEDRDELFRSTFKMYMALINDYLQVLNLNMSYVFSYFMDPDKLLQQLDDMSALEQKDFISMIYDTLFLVAPIQSSTFASFGTFYEALEAESIGYVVSDESGQALASTAVGAFYRAKNVLVLGDPYQTEPIENFDNSLEVYMKKRFLKKHIKNDDTLIKSVLSVQSLADNASVYGGYTTNEDGSLSWIGVPLRVHMRCHQPMFDISNKTTYHGRMVLGIPSVGKNQIIKSRWIHIPDSKFNKSGFFLEDQAEAAYNLLIDYFERINQIEEELITIYIISPFKSVVTGVESYLKSKGLPANLKVQIGTVHAFQGKQNSFVILILGGGARKNSGGIKWAKAKPNILNVAATRAIDTFVVIGDKNVWATEGYYKTCYDILAEWNGENNE